MSAQFKFPKFFSSDLRDLLEHMIQKDLTRRYGNLVNGVADIKNHNWFNDINWLAVLEKKVIPIAVFRLTNGDCLCPSRPVVKVVTEYA